MAKHIFSIALSNDASEINWKHYKDCSTKERSRLTPEAVHKTITIQQDAALQYQCYNDYKRELAKWTIEDELFKLDKQIQQSRTARVLHFKNFIEEWETNRINLKNDTCKISLLEKYMHMYLFDEGEVRRVSDIIWSTARPANYQLVTLFVEMIDTARDGDEDDVNYLINDELHKCISAAKDILNKSYNSEVELVSAESTNSD